MSAERRPPTNASATQPKRSQQERQQPEGWQPEGWQVGFPIVSVLRRLQEEAQHWQTPAMNLLARQESAGAYAVLVGTLLSLRTRDEVTLPVTEALLARVPDVYQLHALPLDQLQTLIRPVGFYRNKARQLKRIAELLIEQHNGEVPQTLEALLELPGVGRKTANLTLDLGYHIPAVCVDVHVHRILNRLGALTSRSPETTEMLIRAHLDRAWWRRVNRLFVSFGQQICRPQSPFCSRCPFAAETCAQRGVTRSR